VKLASFYKCIFDTTYRQEMVFLHSQFIIKNLGNIFYKTSDTSNPTFMKFGFLEERNLQTLESAIRMLRQILVLRIGRVK